MASNDNGNKYVKAGVGYTFGNYLLKGISFFTMPLFIRLMTKADYGNFNTYSAYESIFCIIIGLALYTSLKNAKYKYKKPGEFESYISSCLLIGIFSTLVFIVLANLTYPLYYTILDMSRGVFNLLIIESYAVSLITTYNVYISLFYKYRSFLVVSFTNVLLNVLLSLLFMFTVFKDNRFLARVYGTAIPVILLAFIIALYFFRLGKIKFVKEHWIYALTFCVPLLFHGVSQVVLNQFDRIMIKTMTGADNAATYSFAYNISSLVLITSTSLQQVWQPWFYERMEIKDYQGIRSRGNQFAFGMFLFVACVICGIKEVSQIIGTNEYSTGIYYLIPILIAGYFAFLYNLPAQVEYYYEKTKYIAIGTCVAAILNVILNYFGVRFYGSIAAAYTTLIIYALYFCIHYYLAIKVHSSSLFSGKKILLYSILLLVIGAFALFFVDYWVVRWSALLCFGLCFVYWLNKEFGLKRMLFSKIGKKTND